MFSYLHNNEQVVRKGNTWTSTDKVNNMLIPTFSKQDPLFCTKMTKILVLKRKDMLHALIYGQLNNNIQLLIG
jgi:hypothetical protein